MSDRRESHAVFTLHRYYLTADTMRSSFLTYVGRHPEGPFGRDGELFPEFIAHMSVWYATLVTAWEGWNLLATDFGLSSPVLESAWKSPLRRKLVDYRNATVHYSRKYMDGRLNRFVADPNAAEFAHGVHIALGVSIVAELERLNPTS